MKVFEMPAFLSSIAAKLLMGVAVIGIVVMGYLYIANLQDQVSIANLKNVQYADAVKTQNDTIDDLKITLQARQDALTKLQSDYATAQDTASKTQNQLNAMIDAQNVKSDPNYQNNFNKSFNDMFNPPVPLTAAPSK